MSQDSRIRLSLRREKRGKRMSDDSEKRELLTQRLVTHI